jgi:uncharacterized protein (DUF1778 family)
LKTERINVRLAADELGRIRNAARERGTSLSEFVRTAALDRASICVNSYPRSNAGIELGGKVDERA